MGTGSNNRGRNHCFKVSRGDGGQCIAGRQRRRSKDHVLFSQLAQRFGFFDRRWGLLQGLSGVNRDQI
ncbi:hypothetical protein SLA2020_510920 [Shorea laevis]